MWLSIRSLAGAQLFADGATGSCTICRWSIAMHSHCRVSLIMSHVPRHTYGDYDHLQANSIAIIITMTAITPTASASSSTEVMTIASMRHDLSAAGGRGAASAGGRGAAQCERRGWRQCPDACGITRSCTCGACAAAGPCGCILQVRR